MSRSGQTPLVHACLSVLAVLIPGALLAQAQADAPSLKSPHNGGSANIHVASHLQLGYFMTTADIAIEQELSRPYVYMPRRDFLPGSHQPDGIPSKGVDVVSIKDLKNPKVIYSWRISE